MLTRRGMVTAAASALAAAAGGTAGLLGPASAVEPAGRARRSPWRGKTWRRLRGAVVLGRGPDGVVRRLKVKKVTASPRQAGLRGACFTVRFRSNRRLPEGIYRLQSPDTGRFEAFLASDSRSRTATMVVNRLRPVD